MVTCRIQAGGSPQSPLSYNGFKFSIKGLRIGSEFFIGIFTIIDGLVDGPTASLGPQQHAQTSVERSFCRSQLGGDAEGPCALGDRHNRADFFCSCQTPQISN